ncbi:protein of unknown function [Pseudomonas inefficax]|uniref:Uncharacterized protein n=1 Tax=Pseudomonas inefficax TaxID=2078786 RepID=A0AAQ1SSJ2_9PSED|nr:protein of unknown function [Pseudomonas inefficax]
MTPSAPATNGCNHFVVAAPQLNICVPLRPLYSLNRIYIKDPPEEIR